MKKWVLRIGVGLLLAGGLWILSTIEYAYDYTDVTSLSADQLEGNGKAGDDGCDGWALPIMMR